MKSLFQDNAQRREVFFIRVLSVFSGLVIISSLLENIMMCYQLGKDDSDDLMWRMVPESVTLLVMIFCAAIILRIIHNLNRKRVFVMENARLVQIIGLAVMGNGVFQGLWMALMKYVLNVPVEIGFSRNIFLLLGAFFVLIGSIFKIGVRMKVEQELTI